jgi:hypothetical protein
LPLLRKQHMDIAIEGRIASQPVVDQVADRILTLC